ncbi:MAG: CBS domain-containing protein [Bradyrhizobium sp.]|jgi:CBS domain-containing protein|nr:CBS domain-containing protein [Bradyrhizobium sp.]
MRAHEIMSRHVITTTADTPAIDAIKIMLSHHVSGLPVVDSRGKLIGILSEGDFVRRWELGTEKPRGRWLGLLAGPDRAAVDFSRQHGRTVGQIMSPDPIAIGEETPLEQIVRLMESRNVKRLPVIRGDEIVGMVTRADFLTAIANLSLDIRSYSETDDQIRNSVIAAISRASWRPCALNVSVHDGVVVLRGTIRSDNARKAVIVASENVAGVRRVEDQMLKIAHPVAEEDYGGGDFVSLQEEPSTADDEPL